MTFHQICPFSRTNQQNYSWSIQTCRYYVRRYDIYLQSVFAKACFTW